VGIGLERRTIQQRTQAVCVVCRHRIFLDINHRDPVMTSHLSGDQPGVHSQPNPGVTVELDPEQVVRNAYKVAEEQDVPGWISLFTEDGTFTDTSIGVTYRGQNLGDTVEVYAKAFPDMHRELFQVYVTGNIVVVQLALQGTHTGQLTTPMGVLPPTGNKMDAPCCDVFEIVDGKIKRFDCYPAGTIIFGQLGILANIQGAMIAA
jgi:ketosteroid isomerase-like protein